ncbi:hypothetical protein PanWU01x14_155480 [Parasponia andersonii]|uniref:Factor of DNA methylation 1-5/IDN2 domain-containing protein n=1 Tax=Parasponia andersonii TaxID=3476 RepID=A0A2P5CG93_PARAD|nr:hypothetical protein PanWU01x14_155480 [Parasponia andersonii]
MEMNEYSPSGRTIVPELWNFEADIRASLKEMVEFMLDGGTPKHPSLLAGEEGEVLGRPRLVCFCTSSVSALLI